MDRDGTVEEVATDADEMTGIEEEEATECDDVDGADADAGISEGRDIVFARSV